MTIDTAEKVRENRIRRMAARQRLKLIKCGRRDTNAWNHNLFFLVRPLDALKPSKGIDHRGSVNERCEIALTPEPLPLSEIEKILLTPRVTAGEPAGRTDPEAEHA
jgi:hypothetical protein